MKTFALKFSRRTMRVFVEGAMLLGAFVVFVVCFSAWRLNYAPVEIGFAKAIVREALNELSPDFKVDVEGVYLHWPDLAGPLQIELRDAVLYGLEERKMLSIDNASVSISKRYLALGKLRPEVFTVRNVSLQAVRNGPYDFNLGLGALSARDVEDAEGNVIDRVLTILSRGEDGGQAGALARLERLEIENASIVIDDKLIGESWSVPRADFVFEREEEGLRAEIDIEFPSILEKPPILRLVSHLNKNSGAVHVDAVLRRFSPSLIAEKFPDFSALAEHSGMLGAKLEMDLDRAMQLQAADLAVVSKKGVIRHPDLSVQGIPFKNFGLLATFSAESGLIELRDAQLTLNDVKIEAAGELEVSPERNHAAGPLRLAIEKLAQAEIAPLWPVALKGDNSESWVVHKLSNGLFSNLFAEALLVMEKGEDGWSGDVERLNAGFEFTGMDVDYRAPMMPASDARGKGYFDLETETLIIEIDEAKIEDIAVKKADLQFKNIVQEGQGVAELALDLDAPLNTVLQYVQREPLGVKLEFDPTKAKGRGDLKVNVSFPTVEDVPKEAVKVSAEGTIEKAMIPGLVQGLPVAAEKADVAIKDGLLTVKGRGQFDGRDTQFSYEEYLISEGKKYSSKVAASLRVDEDLRRKFGIDLSEFLSGSAMVDLVYTTYSGGRSEADVNADLGTAFLYIKPFDYEKPPGQAGRTNLKAILKDGALTQIVDLTGTAPRLQVQKTSLDFRGKGENTELAGAQVSRFVLGETIAKADLKVTPAGVWKISMSGQFFDARPFLGGEKDDAGAYDGPPMQVSVSADRARTTDDAIVRHAKVYADVDARGSFNQLEADAIAGRGDIYLRYKPGQGATGRVFRFEAEDAGATLKALGLYSGVEGGEMLIQADPVANVYDRNLKGKAEITNFTVVDAPALARLLGLLSLPGLINTLEGEGLGFAKMEADFNWLFKQDGSVLVLKNGRTSGNSLGLTFDGTFNNATGIMNVEGTVIPLSGINKFIGSIPLLGDLITGGTGSLIAATYTMKGKATDPDIFVNPLSVLTPGILRRILFEDGN